jgi:hypothetical protein
VPDPREVTLQPIEQRLVRPTLEQLADEGAARRQHRRRRLQCHLRQRHDPQVVRRGMASGVRRHVGQHDIRHSVKRRAHRRLGRRFGEIGLEHGRAGHRVHRQDVERHHLTLRSDGLHGNLGPAAGRGTEVHDAQPRLEQPALLIEFQQLERRPAAEAGRLRRRHIRIVQLAFEPTAGLNALARPGTHAYRHPAPLRKIRHAALNARRGGTSARRASCASACPPAGRDPRR